MSRKSQGPTLRIRKARRDCDGNITHRATWIIRDRRRQYGTGCAEGDVKGAEEALRDHISKKYQPRRREQDIEKIKVADVIAIFIADRPELYIDNSDAQKYVNRMDRIEAFFGGDNLSDINRHRCNAYVAHRGNKGGARRDLEDLRAAIAHHAEEGFHRGIVKVSLPPKGRPRDRWLTRSEAARLIWECWRAREVQKWSGREVVTDKRPLRHLARFILIGLYSGTRAGAIASASPIPAIGRSYVDLDRGVFYRLAQGKAATNKRQPPMPIPPRLLAHLRRWHDRKIIARHFVEWNGEGVKSVKTGFKTAVALAKLGAGVSPHTLRHTAATWLMQNGTEPWQAAGYLGMSMETLLKVYGHHHPDFLSDAVDKIGAKPKGRTTATRSPHNEGRLTKTNVIKVQ